MLAAALAVAAATVSPATALHDGRATFRFRLADGRSHVERIAPAAAGRLGIGGFLSCAESGTSFVYGTAGPGVRRVKVVFADGRRAVLRRSSPPQKWHYSGHVFVAVREAHVSILEVRGFDRRGARIATRRYYPATPCPQTRPPEPQPNDRVQVDPDISTGKVAYLLGRAERRWRRSRIDSYDIGGMVNCFCAPPANRWHRSSIRGGRRVRGDWSVLALFRAVRDEIESRPASLSVEYGRHGIPRRISVDHNLHAVDDEVTIASRHFHPH
jgi:hypothetical protein